MDWFRVPVCCAFFSASLFAGEKQPLPKLADLPVGITSFGAAFHEGAIYVHGGQLGPAHAYNRNDVSQPLYRLKFEEGATWESLPPDEPALGPSLLSHPSGLIRIGGMQPRNDKGEEADMVSVPYVRRFDPQTGAWTPLPDLPQGRSSHDACIAGDKIYVAGGWEMRGSGQSSLWSKTVDVLDLSQVGAGWRRIPQPFFRRALAVVARDGELFCMGGLEKSGETSLEIDILDLQTETWKKGGPLPDDPLKGFGLAAGVNRADGMLYITGFSGVIHALEKNGGWRKSGQFRHGRMFGRFVEPPDSPLLILGGAEQGGRPLALEFLPSLP